MYYGVETLVWIIVKDFSSVKCFCVYRLHPLLLCYHMDIPLDAT